MIESLHEVLVGLSPPVPGHPVRERLTVPRGTPGIGEHHHIPLRGEHLKIPAIVEGIREHSLGSPVNNEKHGVFPPLPVVGRTDDGAVDRAPPRSLVPELLHGIHPDLSRHFPMTSQLRCTGSGILRNIIGCGCGPQIWLHPFHLQKKEIIRLGGGVPLNYELLGSRDEDEGSIMASFGELFDPSPFHFQTVKGGSHAVRGKEVHELPILTELGFGG